MSRFCLFIDFLKQCVLLSSTVYVPCDNFLESFGFSCGIISCLEWTTYFLAAIQFVLLLCYLYAQGEGGNDLRILVPRAGDLSPRANSIEEAGNQSPGVLTYDAEQDAVVSSGNSTPVSSPRFFNRRHSTGQSTPVSNDRAGPSDIQSFSDSLKSRLNAVSTKYKESITKSTRGWKERLFSRNSSVSDLGSEVRREVNNGIASVSRMMERLETRGSSRTSDSPTSSTSEVCPTAEPSNERVTESNSNNTTSSTSNTSAPCVTASGSN
uniref:Uncharacterized protein n=1 Tax=Avena sativa TaxID=4498 RepID=A0ACD5X6J5_AVESA